jgi:hypothetical protein
MTSKLHHSITSLRFTLLSCLALSGLLCHGADFVWQRSLTFPLGPQGSTPNPVNAQNIVAHQGKLFAGFATVGGGSYGDYQSYVYRKDSATSPWVLDATFPPGTLRVDSLISARFENDEHGNPIPGGPVTRLVAATNKGIAATGSAGVRIFVRDDTAGTWIEQQISTQTAVDYEARNLMMQRDTITGADRIFVAASPAPFGIYAGVHDASVPGGIRWHPEPEQVAESNAGSQKWFGMDVANGKIFASNRWKIYQRNDGAFPATWTAVATNQTTGTSIPNPELRGLTGVPNPTAMTGWPEPEMLIFSWRSKIWRMRAAPPWTQVEEVDLVARVAADTGRTDIHYVEAIPNTVLEFTKPGDTSPTFPIGFQVTFGSGPSGATFVTPRNIFNPGDMTGVYCGAAQGLYYERDVNGNYGPLQEIVDPAEEEKELIWPRDWVASPFAEETNAIYCAGYNVSVAGRSGNDALGRAWVYKGAIPTSAGYGTFDVTLTDASRTRDITLRVYYPQGLAAVCPLILVSHGGTGSTVGHTRLAHLGPEYAANGYVAVHVGHRASASNTQHRLDRPADVSFVLDQLIAGNVTFPPDFQGVLDFNKVGHAGHSWGAYTANAVGGGTFTQGYLRDPRIKAICPFSPQGPGGFGAFDNGPSANTWRGMTIPTYSMLGSLEKDGSVGEGNSMEDWRLFPFMRYSLAADHYLSVLPGQDHGDIGGGGSPEVRDFLAQNSRVFFDVYLKGQQQKVCDIGQLAFFPGTVNSRKYSSLRGAPVGCESGSGGTLTFAPHADATVRQSAPNTAFGTNNILRLAGNTAGANSDALLKFNVTGVTGTVLQARLRLYNEDIGPGTVTVHATETGWSETTVTWNTAPAALEALATLTNPPTGQYVEWDVTAQVQSDGTHSFRLTHSNPANNQDFTSREGAANLPQLVVTYDTRPTLRGWRHAHFATLDATGAAANLADADDDGMDNLLECALDRVPTLATGMDGTSALPIANFARTEPSLTDRLVLELDLPQTPPADITYEVQESQNLTTWIAIARKTGIAPWQNLGSGAPIVLQPPAAGRIPTAIGSSLLRSQYPDGRLFLRLSVSETP